MRLNVTEAIGVAGKSYPHHQPFYNILKMLYLFLGHHNQPIPSLGIPAYNWWNDAAHGLCQG